MKRRAAGLVVLGVVAVASVAVLVWASRGRDLTVGQWTDAGRPAEMRPDWSGAVIPPNIAPLNFKIGKPATGYVVRISSTRGEAVEVASHDPSIVIPQGPWRRLLQANRGEPLRAEVFARGEDGTWWKFQAATARIAAEDIDGYLVYRLIRPLHGFWSGMALYERNLATFDERLVVDNKSFGEGCVNCHTFRANQPGDMVLHTRAGSEGSSTILARGGKAARVDTRTPFGLAGYTSWHPSGELVVFAVVKVRQFFHPARTEVREVIDLDSTLVCYRTADGTIETPAGLGRKDRLETYPCWSPDGRYLYFSSAPKLWPDDTDLPPERYADVLYDLMRIRYDADSGQWGEPEAVLTAAETGLSITQPRVSPDGRLLLCCMAEFGCFPVFHRTSDLHMVDLATKQHRRLAASSDECDSWHSWSSNGRWIVFSSKRGNGLFARPYISYVDVGGVVHKPILLPQEDSEFYDSLVMTYNLPELVVGPVPVGSAELGRLISTPLEAEGPMTSASPPASPEPQSPPH